METREPEGREKEKVREREREREKERDRGIRKRGKQGDKDTGLGTH